jgi:hypothetical protein
LVIQLKSTLILCISVPGWNVSFQNVDIGKKWLVVAK